MKSANILIIEDDIDIRESVSILLTAEGFNVTQACDGMDGLNKLSANTDLIILDIMMPGISGIKTCEEIRKVSFVPILFLTAKSSETDKIVGLTAGGDDYLVKPFSYAELFARIKALLRRQNIYSNKTLVKSENEYWIEKANIRICTERNEVYSYGKEVLLTETEYEILLLMMKYPKKIFSVKNIYETVWNEPFFNDSANTVMVHIRKLRMKIEKNPQKPRSIQTVWGKGYRFEENTI